MHLLLGTSLQGGKYKIIRVLGQGGFGITYEAEHVLLWKRVAVKEFFVGDFCSRDKTNGHVTVATQKKKALVDKLRSKFIDEARSLSGLHHTGIVSVSDVFEENGTAYFVMDYIDGKSLSEIVREQGPLSEEHAVRYIKQVAAALQYVHANNYLHLDIKPGNIMIASNDIPVLIDFGASKQYDEEAGENTSTLLGKTPGYAPPEQMSNGVQKFLPATDIYSLGATLYKLLTGITPPDSLLRISGEEVEPLPACVSSAVQEAVTAAMELNKTKRPQAVASFVALLGGCAAADGEQTTTGDDQPQQPEKHNPTKQEAPKTKWRGAVIAACLAALVVIGTLMIPHFRQTSPTEEEMVEGNKNNCIPFKERGKYGIKDQFTGQVLVAPKYDFADHFSEGLALVRLNDKYGFIDKNGKEVTPFKYDLAYDFCEGLALVELNGKYGFIDKKGKEITSLKYDDAYDFFEGLAWVELNDKYGFIDKKGKVVIPLKYDWASSFSEGLVSVGLNGKWGFIDKKGKVVIPFKNDWSGWGSYFREGLAMVTLNGKCGYIDKTGAVVIPFKYDVADNFREGLASVKLNGKWGYIDKTGSVVIPLKYEDDYGERYFRNGVTNVRLNGERITIDKKGNQVAGV